MGGGERGPARNLQIPRPQPLSNPLRYASDGWVAMVMVSSEWARSRRARAYPAARLWHHVLLLLALLGGGLPLGWAQTYVGSSTATLTGAGSDSLNVGAPAGLVAGDVMLIWIAQPAAGCYPILGGASNTGTCNGPGTVPAGWTKVLTNDNGSSLGVAVYSKVAAAADLGATYSWQMSANGRVAMAIAAFRGVDTVSSVAASAAQVNASGTTMTAPSVSPASTNSLLVALYATANGAASTTAPSGFTEAFDVGTKAAANGVGVEGSYALQAAAGASSSQAATASLAAVNIGALVALKAAAVVPVADWRMDESSWSGAAGEVADSGSLGTLAGTAASSGGGLPSPGTAKLCNGGSFSQGYVKVPYNAALNPTNATFSSWIYPTASGSYYPIMGKDSGSSYDYILYIDSKGRLILGWGGYSSFSLFQPANQVPTASAIALNTWTHVAVTFNDSGNAQAIYLNGSAVAAGTGSVSASLGASNSPLQIGFLDAGGFLPLQFQGKIDEVKIYKQVLSTTQITAIYTNEAAGKNYDGAARSCSGSGPDHYELSLPTTSINCLPSTAIVTACADSTNPCSNKAITLSGKTATLAASGGTLAATTLTFDATGVASTTLSYPAAANATAVTVTLSGEQAAATNARKCCPNGANCAAGNSCSTTFNTAGFIFAGAAGGAAATIPAQTAGTSSATYYLRAVQSSTTTSACAAALTGASTVSLAYQCNNPATCYSSNLLSINGGAATTIAANPNTGVSTFTAVAMSFDASGNAPFTLNYADAGQVTLLASKTANSASLSGSSNAFVTKPGGFALTATCGATANVASQSSPSTSDPKFCSAGSSFSVAAVAQTAGGATTPNFGRETVPESAGITWSKQLPAGGSSGTLPSASLAYSGGYTGTFTASGMSWSEVGTLAALVGVADGDYLGAGNVTSTAYVGRFYPHHFKVVVTPQCGSFIYGGQITGPVTGQPFTLTATAMNNLGTPTTTTNYDSTTGWANAVSLTLPAGGAAGGLYVDTTAGGTGAVPAAKFASGVGQVNYNDLTGKISYAFTTFPTTATTVTVHADDADSATSTGIDGSTTARAGRLRLLGAYGSELLTLRVPLRAEYYAGSNAWALNTADTCTPITSAAAALGDRTPATLGSSVTSITNTSGGIWNILLAKPAAAGYADLVLNLGASTAAASVCLSSWSNGPDASTSASLSYLLGNWCGATYSKAPLARVRFGSPKAGYIYRRERY